MSSLYEKIRKGYEIGDPIEQIAHEVGLSNASVRRKAKEIGLIHPNSNQGREDRARLEIESLGLDPKQVDHGWIKTDSASIHFRNDISTVSVEDLTKDLVQQVKKHAPKYKKINRQKVRDPHLLIIDPADVHVGKLALAAETGEDYNIDIAKQRCIEGVTGLIDKAKGFCIDKIMLIIGNDILHFDTPKRTTTSGTPQDTDGQLHQIFKESQALYVNIIETLLPIADIEVIYNPSNHDYMSGFMLAQTLEAWFRHSKNIKFDVSISHRKYSRYGKNLFCTSHGDGANHNDMPSLMSTEHPDWSNKETQFRYIYLHHLHHKKVTRWNSAQDTQGVQMQILRSPSAPDAWHYKSGYSQAPRAVEGFIHHKESGQVATLTHYFQ